MKAKPRKKTSGKRSRRTPTRKNHRTRAITRRRAVQIAVKACTPDRRCFECFDTKPPGYKIYPVPEEPCWFIRCPWCDGLEGRMLRSGRLVIISKRTGRVLYNFSACDEG